jgi:polyisoprenoid-binding protein YceI
MSRRYVLDPRGSRFTVQAFSTGVLGGFAHSPKFRIRDYSGELSITNEEAGEFTFAMKVAAGSLELIDSVKEADRKEIQRQVMDEVLEVQKFPEISFAGKSNGGTKIADGWFRSRIEGEMVLHGVKGPLHIEAQLRLTEAGARLGGEFELRISDYKIKRVTGMAGLVRVKDELKFEFDLVGQEGE